MIDLFYTKDMDIRVSFNYVYKTFPLRERKIIPTKKVRIIIK